MHKITKDQLQQLYLSQKLSDSQIGQIYGLSVGQIHRLRGKYQIKSLEPYQRHHRQQLSDNEKQFLVGTLLGDGHIRKRPGKKSYPQLMLEQSAQHRDYAFWLRDQIKNWLPNPEKDLRQTRKVQNGKIYHSYPIASLCHPVFEEFFQGFYQNSKKIINPNFLSQYFSELSLAVWIMDDGTLSHQRNMVLSSQSFSEQENHMLKNVLQAKFRLTPEVWKNGKFHCLGFSKKDSQEMSQMVRGIVIPSMHSKLISPETTKETELNNNSEGIVQSIK